jgi:hypothetical protein
MRTFYFSLCACVAVGFELAHAQGPVTPRQRSTAAAANASSLPVRRVVLYKNGIGYFEHLSKVRGNQSITVDFNSAQLNDVLKSLTALDLGNGRVTGISYNSDAPIGQQLTMLKLPLSDKTTLPELLTALRGARLEVRTSQGALTGRLLGIERRTAGSGPNALPRDELSLVSDGGNIHTVELTPAVSVRLVDRDSSEQVGSYLGLLASTRLPDRRRMTITTAGTGERDLLVSYVSEVPIWKTNYRVVLSRDGEQPLLQGWAIVDNTTGEDWNDVELSLVAGAPQSFIEQISQPRYARRPVVQSAQGVLLAPQTHDPTLTVGVGSVRGTVRDTASRALPGATVQLVDLQRRIVAQTITDQNGAYFVSGVSAGTYRLEFVLTGFQTVATDVTVAANAEMNQVAVMRAGSLAETVTVTGNAPASRPGAAGGTGGGAFRVGGNVGGVTGGIGGGLQAAPVPPDRAVLADKLQAIESAAAPEQLADLFEYRLTSPISIRQNQSALVPILNSRATVERVSLWNGRAGVHPLRALWLTNSTALTLDGGSFTVIDDGAFAGEGLIEPLKPAEKRLLSYAVDLGVLLDSHQGDERRLIRRLIVQRGVAIEQIEQRTRRIYTIRNNDTSDRMVVIEHPIRVGWSLVGELKADETSGPAYRFKVAAPASTTTTFTVDEKQPAQTQYDVQSFGDDQFALLVRDSGDNEAVKNAIQPILEKKAAISAASAELADRHREIQQLSEDEHRIRENLNALKNTVEAKRSAQRYAAQLTEAEERIDQARRDQTEVGRNLQKSQAELQDLLKQLGLDITLDD